MDDHPRRRKEDQNVFEQANHVIDRYRWVILAALGVLAYLGVTWDGPADKLSSMRQEVKIVSERVTRIEEDSLPSIRRSQQVLAREIGVLTRLRCFDRTVTPRERSLAGLDCSEVFRGQFRVDERGDLQANQLEAKP